MKIAVAMCTYNGASHLEQQLESLVAQTRLPDELVVCDDASTDGKTPAMLHAFAAHAPFPVRVVENKSTLGSNKNFEKAIGLCDADVISLSDQDDVWHPHKLQRFEAAFSSLPNVGLVFCDADIVDETLQPMGMRLSQVVGLTSPVQERMSQGNSFRLFLKRNFISGNAMAFRACFKPLILPIPTHLTLLHDGWIAVLLGAVTPFHFINEPLISFRQHARQQNGAGVPLRGSTNRHRDSQLMASILAMPYAQAELDKLEALRLRLEDYQCLAGDEVLGARGKNALTFLKCKGRHAKNRREHLQVRAALPVARLRRVPLVARELMNRRYQHHSSGVLSALKDVLLRREEL